MGCCSRQISYADQQVHQDRLPLNTYHRSISPALQKPGKADYSNPRVWRLVHLLSTMGKWIEKVIAMRLLYYAKKYWLIHPNQFGAMLGKSTTDTAMCLTHNIHAANNHNLFTSLLMFDITGYFDNINHNGLLVILQDKGVLLPICKWVHSFMSRWETRIRIDGFTDRARAVRMGCPRAAQSLEYLLTTTACHYLRCSSKKTSKTRMNPHKIQITPEDTVRCQ